MVNKNPKKCSISFMPLIEFYLKSTLTIEESFVTSKLLSNQIEMIDRVQKGVTTQESQDKYTQYRFTRNAKVWTSYKIHILLKF